jgi:hypothetical protein
MSEKSETSVSEKESATFGYKWLFQREGKLYGFKENDGTLKSRIVYEEGETTTLDGPSDGWVEHGLEFCWDIRDLARFASMDEAVFHRVKVRGGVHHWGINNIAVKARSIEVLEQVYITRDIALASILGGAFIENLCAEFKNDKEIALAAVSRSQHAFSWLSAELQKDKEIALAAVSRHGRIFGWLSAELKADKDIMLAAVTNDGTVLYRNQLPHTRELVLAALLNSKGDEVTRELACSIYRDYGNDKEMALAIVSKDGWKVSRLSREMRADRDVGYAAVRNTAWAITELSSALQEDRELARIAFSDDGRVIKHLPMHSGDKELALIAVANDSGFDIPSNGLAVQHLTERLRADWDVGVAAVTKNGEAIKFLSAALQGDREIGHRAVSRGGHVGYLSAELRADKAIGLAAVRKYGKAVWDLSPALLADKDIGLAAVTNDGFVIKELSPELQADKEIVAAAEKQKKRSAEEQRMNREFFLKYHH